MALSVVLLAAGALLYLNYVGLPGFVKNRVVAALEAEGLDLEFSRLRLAGYRKIVVERLSLMSTNGAAPVSATADRAELKFKRQDLRRFSFKLEALDVREGRLALDLKDTNAPGRALEVTGIQAHLLLEANDQWTVSGFEGEALGAHFQFSGTLTNLLSLKRKPKEPDQRTGDWTPALREAVDALNRMEFSSPPQITMTALGDLKDLSRFNASLSLRSGKAKTPWGELEEVFLRTAVGPSAAPGEQMEASLNLKVRRAATPWGELRDASVIAQTFYPLMEGKPFESVWTLRTDQVATRWFSGRKVDVTVDTRQAGTNLLTLAQGSAENGTAFGNAASRANFQARLEHAYPVAALNSFLVDLLPVKPSVALPASSGRELLTLGQHWRGDWRINLAGLRMRNGTAGGVAVSGDVHERARPIRTDGTWGGWARLAPFEVNWRAEVVDFTGGEARIDRVAAEGRWDAPMLTVATLDSQLYGGAFHLDAALDVATRKAGGKAALDFDLKKIAWLLDEEVRPFLNYFAWDAPPKFEGRVALTAPPWTGAPKNWRDELFRSMTADGSVAAGPASFRGVTCSAFTTRFALTNLQWRLPDAVWARPEGELRLDYTGHAFDPEFRLAIRGGVNPWAALPLLDNAGQKGLKFVEFPEPPLIEGTLTGNLQKPELLRFEGRVAATNLIVRNEPFLDVKTEVVYSNLWIFVTDPIAHRTTNEALTASHAAIDLKAGLMYVTNGFSTTDPYRFTKIIGPGTFRAIEPYRFAKPPTVRGEGIIPLVREDDADIRFQISGDDFSYWRFNTTEAKGGVHWHGQFLEVTNFTAKFYGGELEWEGHFVFNEGDDADYRFKGVMTNANLSLLLRDLIPGATNKLDGTVHGTLVITEANSKSLDTWKGHGNGTLKDGFLWDIPLFGLFSAPLDAIAPGFGRSKVSSGTGTFKVDGGKVYTKDMEVRAPAFRLQYDGTVDFEGNLDAKVEAQLFRNTWIVGRAMSAAFWPLAKAFESKVTGNLAAPKSELAHIPKIMLFPLRPIQTLKELLPKDKEKEKKPAESPP